MSGLQSLAEVYPIMRASVHEIVWENQKQNIKAKESW